MPRKSAHFLWELFLALAAEGGRTEAEGRAAIKELLPTTYAGIVDEVINATGDVAKLDKATMDRHEERMRQEAANLPDSNMNLRIRDFVGARTRATAGPGRTGQGQGGGTGGGDEQGGNVNAALRAFRGDNRV